jgi:hypothetical protein
MKPNMGTLDRIIRAALAVAVLVLYLTGLISGTLAIVLGALAVILLVTSVVAVCPLYLPFKISTRRKVKA